MTAVAIWQVVAAPMLTDRPILEAVEKAALGELFLHAARQDAELVGEPTRSQTALYLYEYLDINGKLAYRLEPATFLELLGEPVPDQPAAYSLRWEQDVRRRPWSPPALRR